MMSLLSELKRRNVYRVGIAYLIVSWLVLQVTDVLASLLRFPDWAGSIVVILLISGFPLALALAWTFELTPDGIKLDRNAVRTEFYVRRKRHVFNVLIASLFAIALSYYAAVNLVFDDAPPQPVVDVSQPVPGFSDRAAIAVLPFVNLSDDRSQDYFADGITEDLITGLQSLRRFPVIARTSTFAYKGESRDVREIASTLGAGYLLEGSVRRTANRVRISAQLIDAKGRHVWAENFDDEMNDIFAVQDEITRQIIGALEPELMQAEMDQAQLVRTEDMEAWDFYLRAAALAPTFGGYVDRYGQPATVESTEASIELARKAVELDPAFADAHTLLGHVIAVYAGSLRGKVGEAAAIQASHESFKHARRGRELSPFSATTCSCYVWFLCGYGPSEMMDLDAALEVQEDAVRLNPSNALARAVLGLAYQANGNYEAALGEAAIAKRLSPRDLDFSFFLTVEALAYLGLGDWVRAADISGQSILMTPLNYEGHTIRIVGLYALGRRAEALSALESLREAVPDFDPGVLSNGPLPASLHPAIAPLAGPAGVSSFKQGVALVFDELAESEYR